MSYKSSQTVSRQSLPVQTAFRVSPAKARKLENVMRGTNIIQHGITQIGFGTDAVDVNNIYSPPTTTTYDNYDNENEELFQLKNDNLRLNYELELTCQRNNNLNTENSKLQTKLESIQISLNKNISIVKKYESEKKLNEERNLKACLELKLLLNQIAISERQERETKLIEDNKMLGRVIQCQTNNFGQINNIWEDGKLFEDLKRRKKILNKKKCEIENQKKELRKLKSKKKNNQNQNSNYNIILDLEIVSIQLSTIKKQISELEIEYANLEYRKALHIKFIRLMREEKKSYYFCINKRNHECYEINNRYVLINLLGCGGFSEVYRGYDLIEHKYIAVKIHQLNTQWSDERKQNYTKHATREYDIQKSLNHENIICLYDVFGINVNSFCTILEYCNGTIDLDMYLKINKILSEKESKLLIIQVFHGLKYLHNTKPKIIIHYDLKPANLLYKNGKIKLTDFGLAKIIEFENHEIELTSQGAGTYWYLPPECFKSPIHEKLMISPKVDIWSAGVIFYQMLFGKKPFGDNLSQDTILNNKTILNAHNVIFPKTKVSNNAKDFIKECCKYDPKLRLSSNQIVDKHPYFQFLRK